MELDTNITREILGELFNERMAQHTKFGQQNYPIIRPNLKMVPKDYCCSSYGIPYEFAAKWTTHTLGGYGQLSFLDILIEEISEVASCNKDEGTQNLRKELIQVAAVAVAMVESLDRNGR